MEKLRLEKLVKVLTPKIEVLSIVHNIKCNSKKGDNGYDALTRSAFKI